MFPLKNKQLIRGCQAHKQAGLGCAIDFTANFTDLYAPFDCIIEKTYFGIEGGNWIWLTDPDGVSIQFSHLERYYVIQGQGVKEGDFIARTGNTGAITTMPHLHIQMIKDGKRIDPETYNWNKFDKGDSTMEQLTQTYADMFGRIWKLLHHGQDPNNDSIQREATEAAKRYFAGERYAANAWIDAHFAEAGK